MGPWEGEIDFPASGPGLAFQSGSQPGAGLRQLADTQRSVVHTRSGRWSTLALSIPTPRESDIK